VACPYLCLKEALPQSVVAREPADDLGIRLQCAEGAHGLERWPSTHVTIARSSGRCVLKLSLDLSQDCEQLRLTDDSALVSEELHRSNR
jgi:hypothetical protein